MLLRQIRQRVDRTLKDVRRGQGVNLLRALSAADVGIDHCALYGLGGPALVPKKNRQIERRQVAREGPNGLRAW